jgi:hypothetical protein
MVEDGEEEAAVANDAGGSEIVEWSGICELYIYSSAPGRFRLSLTLT